MNGNTADKILGVALIFVGTMLLYIVAFTSYSLFLSDGVQPDGFSAWVGFAIMSIFFIGYGIDYLVYAYQIFFRNRHFIAIDKEEIRNNILDKNDLI